MTTWVLADPHAGADPAVDRRLLACLDDARERGVDLLLMGDLFVAWIAVDRFLTDLQREVLGRLESIRAGGATIRFVVGNRDYLPERMLGRVFDDVYPTERLIDLDGVPTYVAHGDLLNPADRPYHAWYRVSRSRPVLGLLSMLPGRAGRRLAAGVERRMQGVNVAYKRGALPMDGLHAIAERAVEWGAHRVLLGHFHVPTTVASVCPVVIAPGWCEHQVVLDGRSLQPVPSDPRGSG